VKLTEKPDELEDAEVPPTEYSRSWGHR